MGDPAERTSRPLRVALVGCNGVLGDIIRETLAAEPDLRVIADVGSIPTDGSLTEADVLVWNNADEQRIEHELRSVAHRSRPRVLATLGDGRDAALWELTPHRTALGAPSPSTLVDTIRNQATTIPPGG